MTAPPPATSPDALQFPPDSCVSLASILRCYYISKGSEIHHVLLIIPVALEMIFSSSLIFTNWGSGRRHLFLVAEGWIFFVLSLIEVLSFVTPAARMIPVFRGIDQSIGALSFLQILFYMAFLYAFVRAECLPIVPLRFRRVVRPLLLLSIPPVIAVNTIASFAGIKYVPGLEHVKVSFRGEQERFVWTFFSSITLALFTAFQASCFCFAFYRLVRALLAQRNIESDSKDAAVIFKGIGWINAGIKLGAIETVIGFVFYGIPIAYVRRVLRLFGRALLCIGVAKGVDAMEDFEAIRGELALGNSSAKGFRRSKLRGMISNPRISTFHHLSPTATAFHAKPRAPLIASPNLISDEKPHPYAASEYTEKKSARSSYSDASPILFGYRLASPAPASALGLKGLPGMDEFAKIKADRMSQYSSKSSGRVTVHYNHGTPSLHLRLSQVELPSPEVLAQNVRTPTVESVAEYRKSHGYPASSTHGRTAEPENLYRYGTYPYGESPSRFSHSSLSPTDFGGLDTPKTTNTLGHGPVNSSNVLEPPVPAYFIDSTRRASEYSQISDLSAAQAEIVDTPRRKVSLSTPKSALARAMLYPVPSTRVAMALSGGGNESSPPSVAALKRPQNPIVPTSGSVTDNPSFPVQQPSSSLASKRRSPPSEPLVPSPRPRQQQRVSTVGSVVNNYASGITVTTVAPSLDSRDDSSDDTKRNTRSLTLQAVRDLAGQFPGLPPGAVVANIGIQAAAINKLNEGDSTSHGFDESRNGSSHGHGQTSTAESTDTEEAIQKRIPAEAKMKGKPATPTPSIPLPPLPNQIPHQQLPTAPIRPARSPQRFDQMQPIQQVLSQAQTHTQFVAHSIDPFDDDDTQSGRTTNELSPLSMSVKLRHPQSFISTMYPTSTRRNSRATTAAITSPTTPFTASSSMYALSRAPSTAGQTSPGILDFGTALKEWNSAGLQTQGVALTGPVGHRRSLSAQTRGEFERQQRRHQKDTTSTSGGNTADEAPDQFHWIQRAPQASGEAPLGRIKSIGKAPRRVTPQPTRNAYGRGSMHLQHLVIPASSAGIDVPISAVEAGGTPTIFGVDKAGINFAITSEEPDDFGPMSAGTEGAVTNSHDMMRSLSILDGGHVPIRLQRGKKELY